jgi:hypothetical protein
MDKLEEEIFWLNRYDANVVAWYWVFIGILDIHDTLENEPFNTYSRLEFTHVCNDMSASSTHVQHMVTGANTMPHVDTFSRDAIEEGATATHSNARRVNSETMILPSWTYSVLLIHPERYVSERSYIERCLVQHLQKSSTNVGGVFLRWRLIWKCSEMPICIVRYLSDMPLHKGNSDNLNPHATAKAMGKPGDQQ